MIGDSIYQALRAPLLRLVKAPSGPPEAPAGSHASLQIFRASPRFLTYRLVLLGIGAVIGALTLGVSLIAVLVAGELPGIVVVALAGLLALPVLVLVWFNVMLDYDLRYYVLTDRSLRVREGALIVREKTLTYANVQNLDLHQGPVQRLLGISDLQVETAGGGAAKGGAHGGIARTHGAKVAGVENAREIRELIRGYLRGRGDTGLGDPDDAPAAAGPCPSGPEAREALRAILAEAAGLRRAAERRAEGRGA